MGFLVWSVIFDRGWGVFYSRVGVYCRLQFTCFDRGFFLVFRGFSFLFGFRVVGYLGYLVIYWFDPVVGCFIYLIWVVLFGLFG